MIEEGQTILVTGGTGSFGEAFVPMALECLKPSKLIVFSRDEMKQWNMAKKYRDDSRVRFFIGDVRDRERLYRALSGVDIVVHAAATKIVDIAEYDPFECVKTNVAGAMNLIDASIDLGVKKVVALSTDKASSPVNLYGATKLVSDKLFIASNAYSGKGDKGTRFGVVRYGNVIGSRGSIVPLFREQVREGKPITVTDASMTRFAITLKEAVELVWTALDSMVGGEIFVKKIPSVTVADVISAIAPNDWPTEVIGVRPGEKLHEQMIGIEDAPFTFEYDDYFKILPSVHGWDRCVSRIGLGRRVPDNFEYSSDKNTAWLSSENIRDWLNSRDHQLERNE